MPKNINLSQKLNTIISTPDQQSSNLEAAELADENFVHHFNEHFSDMDIINNKEKIKAVTSLSNTLKIQQKKQLETIISIGRSFLKTEETFSKKEWDHLLKGTQKLFGIKKSTVSMYRAVAKNIFDNRIPRALCPSSLSTAYQITTLTDKQLEKALNISFIKPELTRKEIISFKKNHKPKKQNVSKNNLQKKELLRLEKLREKLYEQLESVEKRISEMNKNT